MLKCLNSKFMIYIPLCRPILMLDNAGVTEHDRMRRYIYIHITIGCNQHIITNGYPTYNSCIDTNPYFIANGRSTFILSSIRLTYNYSFMDITIAAYTCFWVDCNINVSSMNIL